MNWFTITIILLSTANMGLYGFNKLSETMRKKNTKKLLMKNGDRNRLNQKIIELKKELRTFKQNHVEKEEYNNIIHKHNILLNQYRVQKKINKSLKSRIKKLKEKIY